MCDTLPSSRATSAWRRPGRGYVGQVNIGVALFSDAGEVQHIGEGDLGQFGEDPFLSGLEVGGDLT
jgi:hypothetical protein